jgi:hypothetical protein
MRSNSVRERAHGLLIEHFPTPFLLAAEMLVVNIPASEPLPHSFRVRRE